ncbi:ATP-dependent helicase [Zhihengliuella salsuginis]|uniref:DNA 3'-5' helicase n=1 Tax=Zhihengliuella salsuginis TaxID=578222 RepID=A0ABQ3GFZ9_9MICC|nr:ATP-dependent DNA helicase [Zhihengliuella salsuginis]GHD03680.1 DNA helicase [Zhihengliuella salsuginis]
MTSTDEAAGGQPLDAGQRRIAGLRAGHGPTLVLGAPGTGKTTALLAAVAARLGFPPGGRADLEPEQLLVLTSARSHASRLRDGLSSMVDVTFSEPAVRTWSSYAFDLIRRARIAGFLPELQRPPRLLSGPEQDALIGQILDGHAAGLPSAPDWPESLGEAVSTRGFRDQLRELFDRLAEHGLEPADVQELGARHLMPEWEAAALVYQEYRDLLDLGHAEAFDPAGLISSAAGLLEANGELLEQEQQRLKLLVVDDLQEANPAQYRLLSVLGRGRDVLAFAAPDSVVQGFRGARPDFLNRIDTHLGDTKRLTLDESFRMPPAIAAAWGRIARRIPVSAGRDGRSLVSTGADGRSGSVAAHLVDSPVHEMRYVAHRILEEHLMGGRPLGDIAVIVRHGGLVRNIARHLSQQGIAVSVPPAEVPLREEPAIRPLITLLQLVLDDEPVSDADVVEQLLTSRYGQATALDVRRLRQQLRRAEYRAGGRRTSSELLCALLAPDPDAASLEGLGREATGARRIVRMLAAARRHLAAADANAETALWSLWEASGLEKPWTEAALAGGSAGHRADLDLDALLALFQAAERFIDQLPGSTVRQFVEHISSQELPMDSLAGRGSTAEAVAVLTPASAVGREWGLVLIPGLQEGIWPNTKLRGELLRTGTLAAIVEDGPEAAAQRDAAARVRAVRADEFRSFAAAASRARDELVCIGVLSDDEQPSALLDFVDPVPDGAERSVTDVPRPRTLGALVAHLRRTAEAEVRGEDPATAHDAGVVLAHLADAGIRGAHPDTWWGLVPPSSSGPVAPEGEPVAVSPSRVQAVLESPLNWFVQAAGGEAAVDFARSLGTLVHAIAENMPEATGDQYRDELERRWPELDLPPGWETDKDRERAEDMLRKLALYGIEMRKNGRRLVGQEVGFSVQVSDGTRKALVTGIIDRVEAGDDGRPYVVDLKTGKSKPTAKEVDRHPQLGTYQAAILAGALGDSLHLADRPAGAALVQLGDGTKSMRPQEQPAIGDEDWATPLVLEAAGLMGAADFLARHDPSKGRAVPCRLPGVCPLCDEGRQVTQP